MAKIKDFSRPAVSAAWILAFVSRHDSRLESTMRRYGGTDFSL